MPSLDLLDAEIVGFEGLIVWAVPALVLGIPSLLLLAVLAQATVAVIWLPIIRRRLGAFGFRRRATQGADAG